MSDHVTITVCSGGRHAAVCTCGASTSSDLSATGASQARDQHAKTHGGGKR